jgi:hypothetical protein
MVAYFGKLYIPDVFEFIAAMLHTRAETRQLGQ